MKKNIVILLFMLAFVFVLVTGCPDKGAMDYTISYVNNSETEDVFVCVIMGNTNKEPCVDTILPPKEHGKLVKKGGSKETLYFQSPPCDLVRILLVSQDTIKKYSWEQIRQDYNIIKRYDLSLEKMKEMNWTITYP